MAAASSIPRSRPTGTSSPSRQRSSTWCRGRRKSRRRRLRPRPKAGRDDPDQGKHERLPSCTAAFPSISDDDARRLRVPRLGPGQRQHERSRRRLFARPKAGQDDAPQRQFRRNPGKLRKPAFPVKSIPPMVASSPSRLWPRAWSRATALTRPHLRPRPSAPSGRP